MKKKLIIAGFSIFVCFGATAQLEKGKVMVGGSVGLSTSKYQNIVDGTTVYENNSTYLWVTPRAGYFIADALAVGTGIMIFMRY